MTSDHPAAGLHHHLMAVEDVAFLARDEMRGHRLALEYERAELGMRDQGIKCRTMPGEFVLMFPSLSGQF